MSISGIQGQLLEVTVVGCFKLKDTEWISRQDPYVCLEYASTKFRTRTCTDGGKNPVFQEKFMFTLIEGLREIDVVVWNSNTLTFDDFIGSGKVKLQDVLSRGYDDRSWPLQTKTGRNAGEVKLIMHYANAKKSDHTSCASALPHLTRPQAQVPMYSAPPVASAYPPQPSSCHHQPTFYPSLPTGYPVSSPYSYPDPAAYSRYPYPPKDLSAYPSAGYPPSKDLPGYPPSSNLPQKDMPGYPPAGYSPREEQPVYRPPTAYPPALAFAYPPTPYPPPPHASPYPPAGHYPGVYPPPPY